MVVSCDINKEALRFGKTVYKVGCICADAASLPFRENFFDSIVSLETLEHVKQNEFIANLKASLKDGGRLIMSTPNKFYSSPFLPKPLNPYHKNEYYLGSLLKFLRLQGFKVVSVYGIRKVTSIQFFRRLFGSLLKYLLSEVKLKPSLIDKVYRSLSNRADEWKGMVDPDSTVFPCNKVSINSNMILFQNLFIIVQKKETSRALRI